MTQDEGLVDLKNEIVAIFNGLAEQLLHRDESLIWEASGRQMPTGGLSCWLTVSHRGELDPHLEVTTKITGVPGAMRLVADIDIFPGNTQAEWGHDEDRVRNEWEVLNELRAFLDRNADLLERLAVAWER